MRAIFPRTTIFPTTSVSSQWNWQKRNRSRTLQQTTLMNKRGFLLALLIAVPRCHSASAADKEKCYKITLHGQTCTYFMGVELHVHQLVIYGYESDLKPLINDGDRQRGV